jgi:FG-GAP repeat
MSAAVGGSGEAAVQWGVRSSVVHVELFRPGKLRRRRAALIASGLAALVLLLLAVVPSQGSAAADVRATGAVAHARLESLPLRIDSLIQQGSKLAANDGTGQGAFGYSVAVSADRDTALVGGLGDNGVGAAWVFTRSGPTWTQQGPKLTANDGAGQSHFGISVALSSDGDTALIGGYIDNLVGAAWIFTRSGSAWTQQGPKLTANDETGGGGFGLSVALSSDGDTALIGGPFDNSGAGAAWVFTRSGTTWTQQGPKLTANDQTPSEEAGGARLGSSVALSADGNTALIGGFSDNAFRGAAWVFIRSGATWTQQGPKLIANDESGARAEFGSSVALSADGNTGLIGGPTDNPYEGAAWVFIRSGATWTQQGPKLTADDEAGQGYFGNSVAVSADGDTALIGGPFDNNYAGAAWVFSRSEAAWTQQSAKLTADDETGQGQFGGSVALSADGDTALIGGPFDNNGVGAAWVFSTLLVGSQQVQPNVDSNPAGTAEAFRYTAVGTGSVGQLSVYLDSTSAATKVLVGLYTNTSAGDPGVLLTSGAITNPKAGAWNTIPVPATQICAGTDYWLAVLAPHKAGTIKVRDLPDGTGGPTQTSAQRSLMSMPSSWKAGIRFANSPASLFAAPS